MTRGPKPSPPSTREEVDRVRRMRKSGATWRDVGGAFGRCAEWARMRFATRVGDRLLVRPLGTTLGGKDIREALERLRGAGAG